jgi:hypothetical protein
MVLVWGYHMRQNHSSWLHDWYQLVNCFSNTELISSDRTVSPGFRLAVSIRHNLIMLYSFTWWQKQSQLPKLCEVLNLQFYLLTEGKCPTTCISLMTHLPQNIQRGLLPPSTGWYSSDCGENGEILTAAHWRGIRNISFIIGNPRLQRRVF